MTNISDDKIRFIEIRLVGFIATNPIYKELVRWHHFLVRFSTVADINSIMKSSTAAFPSFLDTVCNKDRISSRLFYILIHTAFEKFTMSNKYGGIGLNGKKSSNE